MKFTSVLFDLDGTLTESGLGITRCAAYACGQMGFPVPDADILQRFVGPPLILSFMEHVGMTQAQAHRAAAFFRERYAETGWRENRVYSGIAPLLRALKKNGCRLAVATAKPEIFARRIAEHFDFARYFDRIIGIREETANADKMDLIRAALPEDFDPARTVMIGDRRFDIESAQKLRLNTIGVLYGYGSRAELEAAGADAIAADPGELYSLLLPDQPRERGRFITFEGADGCGKSTQMALLAETLAERGWNVVTSREPGGCPISESIREVVLDIRNRGMSDICEALLFAAARAEHVREKIAPSVDRGCIVLCDRYLDSSFAYQARGRELGDDFIRLINAPAVGMTPDRTLLFVGDQAKISQRLRGGAALDRMEVEADSFVTRVYQGFADLAQAEPERIHIIDSNRTIEAIFEDVKRDIGALLNL